MNFTYSTCQGQSDSRRWMPSSTMPGVMRVRSLPLASAALVDDPADARVVQAPGVAAISRWLYRCFSTACAIFLSRFCLSAVISPCILCECRPICTNAGFSYFSNILMFPEMIDKFVPILLFAQIAVPHFRSRSPCDSHEQTVLCFLGLFLFSA